MRYTLSELKRDRVFADELRGSRLTFNTTWGLFSPEHVDDGTKLVIDELEVRDGDVCLDLGCGYGPIGLVLAQHAPRGSVHMVDTNFVAVEYAKKNARENGLENVHIYMSNGFREIPEYVSFDRIVSNLPAKPSKELYWILFNDAHRYLKPGGTFTVVVISGLKEFIKRNFSEIFGNYKKLRQGRAHAVFTAVK